MQRVRRICEDGCGQRMGCLARPYRKYPLDFGEGRTFKIVAKALRLILPREELDSAREHSIEDSDNPLDCSSRLYPRLSCFFRIVMRIPLPRKTYQLSSLCFVYGPRTSHLAFIIHDKPMLTMKLTLVHHGISSLMHSSHACSSERRVPKV
ncbi:hypothetical protein VNO77_37921 [Canavalia gladiata]|uniref:Uncharacterized protein n=1 Tax=Canavalia gladiata TaxID=3824 RepID=A0AAN9PUZ6_CANGL